MVFWARAFTPLIPLCPSPKTKKKFVNFLKQVFLSENKKKRNTSANTAYLVTAFYKSLHPYLPPLRYGKHQICRYVTQNVARFANARELFLLRNVARLSAPVTLRVASASLRNTSRNSCLCEMPVSEFAVALRIRALRIKRATLYEINFLSLR